MENKPGGTEVMYVHTLPLREHPRITLALSSAVLHCELICSSSATLSSEFSTESSATLELRVLRRVTVSLDKVPHSRATADLLADVQDTTFLVLKQTLFVFAQLTVPSGVLYISCPLFRDSSLSWT